MLTVPELPSFMTIDADLEIVVGATVYIRYPLPIPFDPKVMVIQLESPWTEAVHAHEFPAVTVTVPDPPLLVNVLPFGLMV